ncbi:hypothetical protein DFH09DRAFT_1081179 [Mycena vulgaris]|nr:hypothetical protein DFH09DRAFT_1081179 [Mycena vulgaris]
MRQVRKVWFNIALGYDTPDSEQEEPVMVLFYGMRFTGSRSQESSDSDDDVVQNGEDETVAEDTDDPDEVEEAHDDDDDLSKLPLSAFRLLSDEGGADGEQAELEFEPWAHFQALELWEERARTGSPSLLSWFYVSRRMLYYAVVSQRELENRYQSLEDAEYHTCVRAVLGHPGDENQDILNLVGVGQLDSFLMIDTWTVLRDFLSMSEEMVRNSASYNHPYFPEGLSEEEQHEEPRNLLITQLCPWRRRDVERQNGNTLGDEPLWSDGPRIMIAEVFELQLHQDAMLLDQGTQHPLERLRSTVDYLEMHDIKMHRPGNACRFRSPELGSGDFGFYAYAAQNTLNLALELAKNPKFSRVGGHGKVLHLHKPANAYRFQSPERMHCEIVNCIALLIISEPSVQNWLNTHSPEYYGNQATGLALDMRNVIAYAQATFDGPNRPILKANPILQVTEELALYQKSWTVGQRLIAKNSRHGYLATVLSLYLHLREHNSTPKIETMEYLQSLMVRSNGNTWRLREETDPAPPEPRYSSLSEWAEEFGSRDVALWSLDAFTIERMAFAVLHELHSTCKRLLLPYMRQRQPDSVRLPSYVGLVACFVEAWEDGTSETVRTLASEGRKALQHGHSTISRINPKLPFLP